MGFWKVNSAVKMPQTQVQKKPFSGGFFCFGVYYFIFPPPSNFMM
jgi:hypothetical protein